MANAPPLFDTPLLSLASARMLYSERRTAVLAQDIANADTPGYIARDLPDFASLLGGMNLAPASAGSSMAQPNSTPRPRETPGPATPDGNAVDVEQTLARLADTDSRQRLASELYAKYLGFFRTATGR
jgi:flagellar basal-body rod protein FlgB